VLDLEMKQKLSNILDNAIAYLVFIVAAVTPLLFFNQTTEFYEMPKLAFLVVATIVLLALWIISWIVKGKIVLTRTPLDIPLLVLLVVVLISTFFSSTRYSAIYGNFPRVHGSAVAWITYILLYFVSVAQLRTSARVKGLLYAFYGSATVISVVSLLSFFKLYMPFDFAKAVNFTPTGSTFSALALLLMLLPLPLISLVKQNKYFPPAVAMVLAILSSVNVVLLGSLSYYIVLALIYVLCCLAVKKDELKKALGMFLIPAILSVIVLVLAYVPGNGLQGLEAAFPKEIQLPLGISWKVSISAFRDAPFFGTGPSSYLFNFTSYKPIEFNQLAYWNFSFDTAHDELLQTVGTLGAFGIITLFVLCIIVIVSALRRIANKSFDESEESPYLTSALGISGIIAIVVLVMHASTLVSTVAMFFVFAAFMMSQKSIKEKVLEFSLGIKALSHENKQFDLFPIIIFIVFLILIVPVLFKTSKVVSADYYHRLALSQANKSGVLTYQYLQKAESLNPEVDLYRVDMAQTNFALANAIALQKGPNEKNPNGSLTNEDKKTIQTLLSQAINEGRVSVALSPRSARNWEVLASIYRNITGVAQNALAFALDSYGRAIQRDPLNPALRLSVGGIYYSAKNYDTAIRYFTDAANLKPDYANAYYNLSIALKDKGDLQTATTIADQLVGLLAKTPNSADYKAATKYDADLKAKLAALNKETQEAQAARATQQTAPAAQTNSALQNSNLPSVNINNLNNPPKTVVSPAPVKANPEANVPTLTPVPTVAPTATP
jgi:tetratricopeptide (TPR) repeat protein